MTGERNDFIRDIIDEDLRTGRATRVATRFPPEPNGYLHIGHAKAICLNFSLPLEFPCGGRSRAHLRMDDTNPTKEEAEYVDSIVADVRWLIAGWADHCLGFKPKGGHPQKNTVNGREETTSMVLNGPAQGPRHTLLTVRW